MNIDGVNSGIVIDHIKAGMGMKIYEYLGLEHLDCCVALIKNVRSTKYGRKDIIKIDEEIDLNLEILGSIDPNVTVNFIRDGKLFKKRHLAVPERLVNVIRCKNPRCITSTEQEIPHIFRLSDAERQVYRCIYCDTKHDDSRE